MRAGPLWERGSRLLLGGVILGAFALRIAGLEAQSLWRDEVDAIRLAQAPLPELLGHFTRPQYNGPLYELLLAGWIALAGTTGFAVRYLSLLSGVLLVPLTCVLARRLFDPATAITAGLLVALSPYLVWYSQEAKMYALFAALSALAAWCFVQATRVGEGRAGQPLGRAPSPASAAPGRWSRGLDHEGHEASERREREMGQGGEGHGTAEAMVPFAHAGSRPAPGGRSREIDAPPTAEPAVTGAATRRPAARWWALLGLTLLVALATHLAAVLLPAAFAVAAGRTWRWNRAAVLPMAGVVGATTAALVWRELPTLRAPPVGRYPFVPLPELLIRLLDAFTMNVEPTALAALPAALIVFLALVGARSGRAPPRSGSKSGRGGDATTERGTRDRWGEGTWLLIVWLLVPIALYFVASHWLPLFADRYFIGLVPPFFLLVALGLRGLWTRSRSLLVVGLVGLVVGFAPPVHLQLTTPVKSDFRAAARYYAASAAPDAATMFVTPHVQSTFAYYHRHPLHVVAPPNPDASPTSRGELSEAEVDGVMTRLLAEVPAIWLIESEPELHDRRGLIRAWLDRKGILLARAAFARVNVSHYRLGGRPEGREQ